MFQCLFPLPLFVYLVSFTLQALAVFKYVLAAEVSSTGKYYHITNTKHNKLTIIDNTILFLSMSLI